MKEILEYEILELEDINLCKQILGFMAVVYRPVARHELSHTGDTGGNSSSGRMVL